MVRLLASQVQEFIVQLDDKLPHLNPRRETGDGCAKATLVVVDRLSESGLDLGGCVPCSEPVIAESATLL